MDEMKGTGVGVDVVEEQGEITEEASRGNGDDKQKKRSGGWFWIVLVIIVALLLFFWPMVYSYFTVERPQAMHEKKER